MMALPKEIEAIRALLGAKPRPVSWTARRQRLDEVGTHWPAAGDIALVAEDLDGVLGEWSMAPTSDDTRLLLYFHGGGYCSGSIASHRRLVTEAGRAAGTRALAIGYRLAPEHPHPAAIEDALSAWRWVRRQGIASERIAIAGDSAGGGLSIVLTSRLRAMGERPGCLWLLSPWTDLSMSGETMTAKDGADPLIHKAYLEELADAYVPFGLDRRHPDVSPLFADLRGLPPTLVQAGSEETLLADSTRLVAAAGAAKVPVTLEIWPDMIHAWPMWNAGLEAGRQALRRAGEFIRAQLG
jgi:acetyl esterase/lipase